MDICQRSSPSEIMNNTFFSLNNPLYKEIGAFGQILCYFQSFTSNTPGRKYPQAAQETRKKIKKPKHHALHTMSRPPL